MGYDFLDIHRIHGYFSDMEDIKKKKIAVYIGHILNLKFNEKIWAFQFHFDRNSATKIFIAPRCSFMFQFHYNTRSTKNV